MHSKDVCLSSQLYDKADRACDIVGQTMTPLHQLGCRIIYNITQDIMGIVHNDVTHGVCILYTQPIFTGSMCVRLQVEPSVATDLRV